MQNKESKPCFPQIVDLHHLQATETINHWPICTTLSFAKTTTTFWSLSSTQWINNLYLHNMKMEKVPNEPTSTDKSRFIIIRQVHFSNWWHIKFFYPFQTGCIPSMADNVSLSSQKGLLWEVSRLLTVPLFFTLKFIRPSWFWMSTCPPPPPFPAWFCPLSKSPLPN